jgi:hypothetical protein
LIATVDTGEFPGSERAPSLNVSHGSGTFDTSPVDTHGKTPHIPINMRYPKPYYDAIAIQDKIMQLLPATGTKEIANIAKGYATLETLKLRLRMKGPPKAVDALKQQPAKSRASAGPFGEEQPRNGVHTT